MLQLITLLDTFLALQPCLGCSSESVTSLSPCSTILPVNASAFCPSQMGLELEIPMEKVLLPERSVTSPKDRFCRTLDLSSPDKSVAITNLATVTGGHFV